MAIEIPDRKFGTTMPLFQIWDSTGTTQQMPAVKFSERDNQPTCIWWPEPVVDVSTITLADYQEVPYVAGWRLVGSIETDIWPEGWTVERRQSGTPGAAPQFTEFEFTRLLDAARLGQRILFYSHADRASGIYNDCRWVQIVNAKMPRLGLAQTRVRGTIEFRGRKVITDKLYEVFGEL
jgi:hypothetical protein